MGHRGARQASHRASKKDSRVLRSVQVDIVLNVATPASSSAKWQMRSLMLMGRSEDELWGDLDLSCGIFLISRVIRL